MFLCIHKADKKWFPHPDLSAEANVRELPATIARLTERVLNLTADDATATAHAADPIVIGSQRFSREDAPAALGRRLDAMPGSVRDTARMPVGIYRGLQFGLLLHPQFPPDVYLEGAGVRHTGLSREHRGPRAVLNALDRLAGAYGSERIGARQDLMVAEAQLHDYKARLGKPFPHEAYLSELTGLRDQLKAELSATPHQADEPGPTASELADRIKGLKATNTIEATPQRTQRKHSSAEEPVTAGPPAAGSDARVRRSSSAQRTAGRSDARDEFIREAADLPGTHPACTERSDRRAHSGVSPPSGIRR